MGIGGGNGGWRLGEETGVAKESWDGGAGAGGRVLPGSVLVRWLEWWERRKQGTGEGGETGKGGSGPDSG